MPEPVLRCPGCGAPSSAESAACAYCGSALATVTCPTCFAAMFMGSRFCAACGAEAKREVRDDTTPLECPRCHEDMRALSLGQVDAHECEACGGLWVDPDTLQRLCAARDDHSAVASALAGHLPRSSGVLDVVRYIPCPRCAKLMNRVNFSRSSGVILDVCRDHGVWLDRGELQRVIAFVEQGGLAIARERERQQLVDEQHRLAAMKAGPASLSTDMNIYAVNAARDTTCDSSIDRLLRDALGLFIH